MNLLFLAPRLPLPADTGGKIRTINILKLLAIHHQVHFVCFEFEDTDQHAAEGFRKIGIKVSMVLMKAIPLLKKAMSVMFDPVPFSIAKYYTPQMYGLLEELLAREKFDAIHVDHLHMAMYQDLFKKIPSYLDEHNVEYKILERCAHVANSLPMKILYANQARKMMHFEGEQIKFFKGVFACSLDDRMILSRLSAGIVSVHVVANGVDTEFFGGAKEKVEQEDALVFTGSMDWLPNSDAICYFCDKILPLVWQRNPNVKLYVVGKSPTATVLELAAKDKRVVVTGRVDDVRPFVHKSKVFIVPLRIGGGTRLKILEAMSMEKAIVSTTIGAEGIDCTDGKDIMLSDQPEVFARQVVDLMADDEKRKYLGSMGRQLVCEKYDWKVVGKQLQKIYEET